MEEIILDSSVLVKLFAEDEKDITRKVLLEQIGSKSVSLVLLDVVLYEFINALKLSKRASNEFVISAIKELLETKPRITSFSAELIKIGLEIMDKFSLTIYDATFIALAEIEKLPLLTADYKHHQKEISKYIRHYQEWRFISKTILS